MFKIEARPLSDGLILDISGALGREAGEAVLRTVEGWPDPLRRLVINFTAAGPINTAGLGGILWVVRQVSKNGGQVSAYGMTDHFRKVCHVMGLTQYVRLCLDEGEALS